MQDLSPREKILYLIKTAGAIMFALSGFAGFYFGVNEEKWNLAMCSVVLEITCVAVLWYGGKYIREEMQGKFSARFFRIAKYVAVAFTIGNLAACFGFIGIGVNGEETFEERNSYAAALVAGVTAFWSLVLFFDFDKYETFLEKITDKLQTISLN